MIFEWPTRRRSFCSTRLGRSRKPRTAATKTSGKAQSMGTSRDSKLVDAWTTRPLCGRYLVGLFRSTTLSFDSSGSRGGVRVIWGLGYLSNGDRELLGWWEVNDPVAASPPQVVEDLKRRGVLKIQTIAGSCLTDIAHEFCDEARSRIGCGQLVLHESGDLAAAFESRTLPSIARELLHVGDRLADEIQTRLSSVARGRKFLDRGAATRFIATGLYRADRRLWIRPGRWNPRLSTKAGVEPTVYH